MGIHHPQRTSNLFRKTHGIFHYRLEEILAAFVSMALLQFQGMLFVLLRQAKEVLQSFTITT